MTSPTPLQVVTEVFNWTRNPVEARRLAARREAVLGDMLGGRKPLVPPGVTQLMDILQRNQVGAGALHALSCCGGRAVGGWGMMRRSLLLSCCRVPSACQHIALSPSSPSACSTLYPPQPSTLPTAPPAPQAPLALVSSAPEARVVPVLEAAGLLPRFDAVVTADDVYRGKPDPEGFLYAAQKIQRPPLRCVVIGASNLSIEAAHEVCAVVGWGALWSAAGLVGSRWMGEVGSRGNAELEGAQRLWRASGQQSACRGPACHYPS